MYMPRDFKLRTAVDLGELVASAYDQFSCFEDASEWKLIAGYELIRELTYPWKPLGAIDTNGRLDNYLHRLRSLGGAKSVEVPIGFMVRRRRDVFLIFRGTQTAKEWVNNFNTKFVPFFLEGGGAVHEGFQNSYLNIRSQIVQAMEGLPKVRRLLVAGHSLGGAFATLAVCDLERSLKRKVTSLYTYGSPRIGDDAFVRAFNASFAHRAFRIANSSDLVTEVPFPVPFAGVFGGYFSHVDTPVIMTEQKNDIEANHAMVTYLAVLREEMKKNGWAAKLFGRFPGQRY